MLDSRKRKTYLINDGWRYIRSACIPPLLVSSASLMGRLYYSCCLKHQLPIFNQRAGTDKSDEMTLFDESALWSSKSYTSTRPIYFLQKVRQIGLNFRLREIRDLVVLLRRNRSVSFCQAFHTHTSKFIWTYTHLVVSAVKCEVHPSQFETIINHVLSLLDASRGLHIHSSVCAYARVSVCLWGDIRTISSSDIGTAA